MRSQLRLYLIDTRNSSLNWRDLKKRVNTLLPSVVFKIKVSRIIRGRRQYLRTSPGSISSITNIRILQILKIFSVCSSLRQYYMSPFRYYLYSGLSSLPVDWGEPLRCSPKDLLLHSLYSVLTFHPQCIYLHPIPQPPRQSVPSFGPTSRPQLSHNVRHPTHPSLSHTHFLNSVPTLRFSDLSTHLRPTRPGTCETLT